MLGIFIALFIIVLAYALYAFRKEINKSGNVSINGLLPLLAFGLSLFAWIAGMLGDTYVGNYQRTHGSCPGSKNGYMWLTLALGLSSLACIAIRLISSVKHRQGSMILANLALFGLFLGVNFWALVAASLCLSF